MAVTRKKDAHLWDRDAADWYVEPASNSLALFNSLKLKGPVWDPACGFGRIVKSAQFNGLEAIGSDIIARTSDCKFEADFLEFESLGYEGYNIISNPPFGVAEDFVLKSIDIVSEGGVCAFLLPLVWMAGFSTKRSWMPNSPLFKIMPISPRPSMPPGKVIVAGEKPGNGTKDFGWFVWKKGFEGQPVVEFLNSNPHKKAGQFIDQLLGEPLCEQQAAE